MRGYVIINPVGEVWCYTNNNPIVTKLGSIVHDDPQVRVLNFTLGKRTAWWWSVRNAAEMAARTWGPEGVDTWESIDLYTKVMSDGTRT